MTTYTAQVGPGNATKLEAIAVDGATYPLMEDIGEGTVRINDLDILRTVGAGEDGSITDDEDEGLQIWVGGEGYPVFDAIEAAVAEATGLQTRYVDAKQTFDHARDVYAEAVGRVVDAAGSTSSAATLLEMDEAELTALVGSPHRP